MSLRTYFDVVAALLVICLVILSPKLPAFKDVNILLRELSPQIDVYERGQLYRYNCQNGRDDHIVSLLVHYLGILLRERASGAGTRLGAASVSFKRSAHWIQ